MRVYGDLGSTYGAHSSRTYGTLFDSDETPPTSGFERLFARVARSEVHAEVSVFAVRAKVTSSPVGYEIS